MSKYSATARSHPNIALIKHWGKRDVGLNLLPVPSLSLTLSKFHTTTTVTWGVNEDRLILNGAQQNGTAANKVFEFLSLIDIDRPPCRVVSDNNFLSLQVSASSASAFSALAIPVVQPPTNPTHQKHCLFWQEECPDLHPEVSLMDGSNGKWVSVRMGSTHTGFK